MSDRHRREIEEKKAKLAELRRARDERKALLNQGEKAQAEVSRDFPIVSLYPDSADISP